MIIEDNGDVMVSIHAALSKGDMAGALKEIEKHLKSAESPILSYQQRMEKVGDAIGDIQGQVAKTFGVQGPMALVAFQGAMNRGLKSTEDFNLALDMVKATTAGMTAMFEKGIESTNDLFKSMMQIRASAGMTSAEFKGLTDGIMQAANETGKSVADVAEGARNLFDASGLKRDLGAVVTDSERMTRVFGSSSETFGKMAAKSLQFSEGVMDSHDMMKAFDKTVGLTGQRMDALLESMTTISKQLRNVVGGGSRFSSAMKAATQYSSQMMAKFTEMGGDSQAFTDIQEAILDPRKWQEIAQRMPGLAGNLVQMQKAFASGDMDTFGKLVQDGAKKTADMGKGMSDIARSAAGIDFTSAEILTKMDWKKVKGESASTADVMARSATAIADLGTQFKTFMNNIISPIMRVLSPVMEAISWVFSQINAFLAANQGGFTDMLVWAGMAAAAWWLIWKPLRAASKMIGEVTKGATQAVGDAVGNVVQKSMEGTAKGIDSLAKVGIKAAVPLLALGASLVLVAGAVWILSQAIVTLATVGWSDVAKGITLLAVSVGIMLGVAFVLAALGPVVIVPLLAFGAAMILVAAAVWIFAQAMTVLQAVDFGTVASGMFMFAVAAGVMVAAAIGLTIFGVAVVPLLAFGAAMILVAGATWIFAQAMTVLQAVDFGTVASGMFMFAMAAGVMVAAAVGLVLIGPAVGATVVPLLGFGAAMVLAAAAVWIFAKAMAELQGIGFGSIAAGMITFSAASVGLIAATWAMAALGILAGPLLAFGGALLMVGGAMILAATGFWIFAQATVVFTQALSNIAAVDAVGVAKGLAVIGAAIGLFVVAMAPFLIPIFGQILLGTMLAVAAAFAVFAGGVALIGSGTKSMAEGVQIITGSADAIEALGSKDFSGLQKMASALKDLFTGVSIGGDVKINEKFVQNVKEILNVIKTVATDMEDIITVGSLLGAFSREVSLTFDMLFNPKTGLLVTSIKQIADAMNGSWFFGANEVSIDKGVMESIKFITDVLGNITNLFVDLAAIGYVLAGDAGEVVKNNVTVAITSLTGWIVSAVGAMEKGLMGVVDDTDLDADVMTTVKFTMEMLGNFANQFATFAAVGAVIGQTASGSQTIGQQVTAGITFMIEQLKKAVGAMEKGLMGYLDDVDLDKEVMDSVKFTMDLLNSFSEQFASLAAIGSLLDQNVSDSKTFKQAVQASVDLMFGSDGIIQTMSREMQKVNFKGDSLDNVTRAMKSLDSMNGSVIEVAAIGSVMRGGLRDDMMAYATSVGDFLMAMNTNAQMFSKGDFDQMNAMGNTMRGLSDAMNKDIKISAKGGAEVAMEEHDSEMKAHYENVELLLAEIRDSIRQQGGSSQAVSKTEKFVPSWRPEELFSEKSEVF